MPALNKPIYEKVIKAIAMSLAIFVLSIGINSIIYNSANADETIKQVKEKSTLKTSKLFVLGLQSLASARYKEAINIFKEVIEIDPKFVGARNGLGRAYIGNKEYENAIREFQAVIAMKQSNSEIANAHYGLGIVYLELDDEKKACSELKKAMEVDPEKYSKRFLMTKNMVERLESTKSLSLEQRKSIFLVFRVAYMAADLAVKENKPYRPEDSFAYATIMAMRVHKVGYKELGDILIEGEERRWIRFVSPMSITMVFFKSDLENRLPTYQEIAKLVGVGGGIVNVSKLANEMAANYPGRKFENAATILARNSSNLKPDEVACVVDAYIKTIKEKYYSAGNAYIIGQYFTADKRFRVILEGHEPIVREILEKRLSSRERYIAGLAAYLLAIYGNKESLPKLKAAKKRLQNDGRCQVFIDVAISMIKDKK